jgi:hypothetical protein
MSMQPHYLKRRRNIYRAASLPTTKSKRIKIGEIREEIQTSTTPPKKTSLRSWRKMQEVFLRFGGKLPPILFIFTALFNQAVIRYLYIILVEYHSCIPHCFRSEGLLWGAEPRIEIGSALPYSKPTLSYLSHTAKFSVQDLVMDILKQASSEIPEVLYTRLTRNVRLKGWLSISFANICASLLFSFN